MNNLISNLYNMAIKEAERNNHSWEAKLILLELEQYNYEAFESCCEYIATTVIGG